MEHMDQLQGGSIAWHDERVLDLLIEKYENILATIGEQNEQYQSKFEDLKIGMRELVSENQRLTAELKQALETQIKTLQHDRPAVSTEVTEHISTLRQQLLATTEEKENVLEMWRVALREIERLEEQLQNKRELSDSKVLQEQTLKVKNYYNEAILSLNVHIEHLKDELKKTREEGHAKSVQISDLRLLLENTKDQILSKDKEKSNVQLREKALNDEIKRLQEKVAVLHVDLASNLHEIAELGESNKILEEQLTHLLRKSSSLEANQTELMNQLKESVQMTEDSLLEKDQALLKLEHARQEIDRLQIALTHLVEEAGLRTKKEVENFRKMHNAQIQTLMEEVKSLEKKNVELQSNAERATRDKELAVTELERVYHDIHQGELQQAYHEVQNRLVRSEHRSAEVLAELETVKAKARMAEENSRQEEKQWEAERRQLREKLKSMERECESYLTSNVQLTEQVEQLQKEAREAQRRADASRRKAIKDCTALETEKDLMEEQWHCRLQSTEEAHASTCEEFKQLLTSQQALNIRLKSELKTTTQMINSKMVTLQQENLQLKKVNFNLSSTLQEQIDKFSQLNNQKIRFYRQIRQLEEKLQQREQEIAYLSKVTTVENGERKARNGFVGSGHKSYHASS